VCRIALVGGLVGLYFFGYSINTLTLFAMVLAVGIVVDDAIVVVENVERIMTEEGLPPREATAQGHGADLRRHHRHHPGAMCRIHPMTFFGGSVGAIYRQFAVTLILTILFSVLMAVSLTPALCATLLTNAPAMKWCRPRAFLGWFNRFFKSYYPALQVGSGACCEAHRSLRGVYAVLAGHHGLAVRASADQFSCRKRTRGISSASFNFRRAPRRERSQEVLAEAEQFYLKQPEVEHVIGVLGFSFFGAGRMPRSISCASRTGVNAPARTVRRLRW